MGDYSPPGLTLSGDLAGPASAPKVVGIQGNPIDSATPTTGDALTWNGTKWEPNTTAAGVSSVFTRTGAVVAATGDYTAAQVTNAADKSASARQTFTGPLGAQGSDSTGVPGLTFTAGAHAFNGTNGIGLSPGGALGLSAGGSNIVTVDGSGNIQTYLNDGSGNTKAIGGVAPGNGTAAGGFLWDGSGAPAAGLGANGDYYLRTDGGANTHLYFKSAGAWAGIV